MTILSTFRSKVDFELYKKFAINTYDAGIDDWLLELSMQQGDTAVAFADRFGQKYDLEERSKETR